MNSTAKKVRKSFSLQTKIEILDCLAAGEKISQAGRKFGMAHSTIITIKNNEASIRQAVERGADMARSRTSYVRDPAIEEMEKTLLSWIDDNHQKRIPVNGEMIRKQALQIHNQLQMDEKAVSQPRRPFHASNGWMAKFVRRYSLRNEGVIEESASADVPDSSASQPQQPLERVELMEMMADPITIDNDIEIKEEHPVEFNQKRLGQLLKMSGKMIDLALDEDLNTKRAVQFRIDLKRLMASYRDLYEKQCNMFTSDYNSSAYDACEFSS